MVTASICHELVASPLRAVEPAEGRSCLCEAILENCICSSLEPDFGTCERNTKCGGHSKWRGIDRQEYQVVLFDVFCLLLLFSLKMEAVYSSETSVTSYRSAECQIPEAVFLSSPFAVRFWDWKWIHHLYHSSLSRQLGKWLGNAKVTTFPALHEVKCCVRGQRLQFCAGEGWPCHSPQSSVSICLQAGQRVYAAVSSCRA
jgi:hypothetical protein